MCLSVSLFLLRLLLVSRVHLVRQYLVRSLRSRRWWEWSPQSTATPRTTTPPLSGRRVQAQPGRPGSPAGWTERLKWLARWSASPCVSERMDTISNMMKWNFTIFTSQYWLLFRNHNKTQTFPHEYAGEFRPGFVTFYFWRHKIKNQKCDFFFYFQTCARLHWTLFILNSHQTLIPMSPALSLEKWMNDDV